jgi:hypothetical protein
LGGNGNRQFDHDQEQDHEQERHKRCLLHERGGQLMQDELTPYLVRLASRVPFCAALLLLAAATVAPPSWPFPAANGTKWQYIFKREPEGGEAAVTREIVAPSSSQKKVSLQMEEKINGAVQAAQTLEMEKGAVVAISERAADRSVSMLTPSVTVLPAKMEPGASWNFRGQIAGVALSLPVRILAEEEVQTAAGKFLTWHIHGEQAGTVATTADRWFAPGVGWVRESVTQRSPSGQLLDRRALELTAFPSTRPLANVTPAPPAFEASVSTSTAGEPMNIVSAEALQIVVRWRVRREHGSAKVRAVWIAEDTAGIVPADYKIDEATAIATPPESVGTFTLSRPTDGWAAGKYRVEFYVQNALAATTRITIAARASTAQAGGEF